MVTAAKTNTSIAPMNMPMSTVGLMMEKFKTASVFCWMIFT